MRIWAWIANIHKKLPMAIHALNPRRRIHVSWGQSGLQKEFQATQDFTVRPCLKTTAAAAAQSGGARSQSKHTSGVQVSKPAQAYVLQVPWETLLQKVRQGAIEEDTQHQPLPLCMHMCQQADSHEHVHIPHTPRPTKTSKIQDIFQVTILITVCYKWKYQVAQIKTAPQNNTYSNKIASNDTEMRLSWHTITSHGWGTQLIYFLC